MTAQSVVYVCRRAVLCRADTVRRLHEDRKQDKLMHGNYIIRHYYKRDFTLV